MCCRRGRGSLTERVRSGNELPLEGTLARITGATLKIAGAVAEDRAQEKLRRPFMRVCVLRRFDDVYRGRPLIRRLAHARLRKWPLAAPLNPPIWRRLVRCRPPCGLDDSSSIFCAASSIQPHTRLGQRGP